MQSTEIAPLVLPAATGGNLPLACTLVAVQEPTRTLTPYGGLAPSEGDARFLLDRRSSWVWKESAGRAAPTAPGTA